MCASANKSGTASLVTTVDQIMAEVGSHRNSLAMEEAERGAEEWAHGRGEATEAAEDNSARAIIMNDVDEMEPSSSEDNRNPDVPAHGNKWLKGALIGAGSLGDVYLGMDLSSGLLMAVRQAKVPKEAAPDEERNKNVLKALEREIELRKDLQHENIVQYLYSSLEGDFLNIFLDYIPGGSVSSLLRNYGTFEEPLAQNFTRQILQGLRYLHERDIIHCGIRGTNILVDNMGGVKIDFGLSKRLNDNVVYGNEPHSPSHLGPVFWLAPEVVRRTAHTTKADIWSVGCLVVEMLTGEYPWAPLTQMAVIFTIGKSTKPMVPIPEDISPDAEDFLKQTFESDYESRPGASELLEHCWVARARRNST